MPKNSNQKAKILYLLNLLMQESDEDNCLSMAQILSKLEALGIKAERKSIYSDLDELKLLGYDILFEKGKGYYIGERDFELAELKLLVDSVQSSKFITKKKSDILIKKLEKLTSKNNAGELRRQVYILDRVKTQNEKIYYNVDKLYSAILNGKKATFKYFQYGIDKTKHLKNNGNDYIVSPYFMTFSDDNYYVVAYYQKYNSLSNFRVDRMTDVRILEEKSGDIKLIIGENFNISEYSKKTFDMYAGETHMVQILCNNSTINAVIDKFGEDVHLRKNDDKTFIISVNVDVSPTFFAWIFTFGNEMKIISPNSVAEQFKEMALNVAQRY